MNTLLTRKDVALQLQTSERTIDRYIKQGKLKAYKIGGLVRISEKSLLTFIEGGETHDSTQIS